MRWTSTPVTEIKGSLRAPGDKSCSHRALILAGLADGCSEISGLLEGDDVKKTGDAMAALGAGIEQTGAGKWLVSGVGRAGLQAPVRPLDFGNSGTGSRLIMGVIAGHSITATLIGDTSLSSRPMARVMRPLEKMGARFEASSGDRLPLQETGRDPLEAIHYSPPQASAQVKSCLLLAGLRAQGITTVYEPRPTRDHSERMLSGFGADVRVKRDGAGNVVSIAGGQRLTGQRTEVPGDPSSVAFLATAAMLSPRGGIVVEGTMSNATRDGFFRAVEMMGGRVGAEDAGTAAGERLIDMSFETSALNGINVPEALVPAMIDEFPILAVLAAFASGETRISGAEELRVKESDRISATINMLRANGVDVEEQADGFIVQGCGGPVPGGGFIETHHDHRIAMSALVMGTASQKPVTIDDASMIATSYPAFFRDMQMIGANLSESAP
jgi:3-phosphoshikimate 1-carboxyvinyltransferase